MHWPLSVVQTNMKSFLKIIGLKKLMQESKSGSKLKVIQKRVLLFLSRNVMLSLILMKLFFACTASFT